jgi:hypothetical protein
MSGHVNGVSCSLPSVGKLPGASRHGHPPMLRRWGVRRRWGVCRRSSPPRQHLLRRPSTTTSTPDQSIKDSSRCMYLQPEGGGGLVVGPFETDGARWSLSGDDRAMDVMRGTTTGQCLPSTDYGALDNQASRFDGRFDGRGNARAPGAYAWTQRRGGGYLAPFCHWRILRGLARQSSS